LRRFRKTDSVEAKVTSGGRLFQRRHSATGNRWTETCNLVGLAPPCVVLLTNSNRIPTILLKPAELSVTAHGRLLYRCFSFLSSCLLVLHGPRDAQTQCAWRRRVVRVCAGQLERVDVKTWCNRHDARLQSVTITFH